MENLKNQTGPNEKDLVEVKEVQLTAQQKKVVSIITGIIIAAVIILLAAIVLGLYTLSLAIHNHAMVSFFESTFVFIKPATNAI